MEDLQYRFELEMDALEECLDRYRDQQLKMRSLDNEYKMRLRKVQTLRKLMREQRVQS